VCLLRGTDWIRVMYINPWKLSGHYMYRKERKCENSDDCSEKWWVLCYLETMKYCLHFNYQTRSWHLFIESAVYTSTGIITKKELPSGRVSGLFIMMRCLKLFCMCGSEKLHNLTAVICGITRTPYRVFVVDSVTNGTAEKIGNEWVQWCEEMNCGSSLTIFLLFVLFGVPSYRLLDKTVWEFYPTFSRIKQF